MMENNLEFLDMLPLPLPLLKRGIPPQKAPLPLLVRVLHPPYGR